MTTPAPARPSPATPAPTPPAITVPPHQRATLAQALADAVHYRDPPVYCPACPAHDTLCDPCAATLARASAYLHLGRALGLDPP